MCKATFILSGLGIVIVKGSREKLQMCAGKAVYDFVLKETGDAELACDLGSCADMWMESYPMYAKERKYTLL